MEIDIRWPWRAGTSVGRTIYACPPGSSPRHGEILIGVMDTPELAAAAVRDHNLLNGQGFPPHLYAGSPDA